MDRESLLKRTRFICSLKYGRPPRILQEANTTPKENMCMRILYMYKTRTRNKIITKYVYYYSRTQVSASFGSLLFGNACIILYYIYCSIYCYRPVHKYNNRKKSVTAAARQRT